MNNYESKVQQLELLMVKEEERKRLPAKRVNIVSLRLVKETKRNESIVQGSFHSKSRRGL